MKILIKGRVIDTKEEPVALVFRDNNHLRRVIKNLNGITENPPTLNSCCRAYIEYPEGMDKELVEDFAMPLHFAVTYDSLRASDHIEIPHVPKEDRWQLPEGVPGDGLDSDWRFTAGVIVGILTSVVLMAIGYYMLNH